MSLDVTEATESISELPIEDSDISDGEPSEITLAGATASKDSSRAAGDIPRAAQQANIDLDASLCRLGGTRANLKSLFKPEMPTLERPILMAAAEQWDYELFKATATSQLPEHGFIEPTPCLGAEMGHNPDPNPQGTHPQGAPGGLSEANLMSAESYAKQKVAATTKGLPTSHGGKGATSEKSPADTKDSPAEALQDKEKDNGQILEDPRTKEYAEHCVGGHTRYNHRCPVCIKGHM